jgi:hypothetical protein
MYGFASNLPLALLSSPELPLLLLNIKKVLLCIAVHESAVSRKGFTIVTNAPTCAHQ